LRAFLYDSVGHDAIEFAADNHRAVPWQGQARLFIQCEAATINRLGDDLEAWTRHPDAPLFSNAAPA
jgi:hypothetical protein